MVRKVLEGMKTVPLSELSCSIFGLSCCFMGHGCTCAVIIQVYNNLGAEISGGPRLINPPAGAAHEPNRMACNDAASSRQAWGAGVSRRSFHRAPEGERRQELIEATLDCISELGLKGATVRQIAMRAGVTAGLVRHYFDSKDQMIAEAYRNVIASLTDKAKNVEGDPATRLKDFIAINLTEPVADSRSVSLWAAFISQVRVDPALAEIHREGYLAFRDALQGLLSDFLAAKGRPASAEVCRRHAIAINGLVDGLWVEGCLAGDLFREGELISIAMASVEALLGLPIEE